MADKLNPQQFAARIRSKHPGAYDDITDVELTQKVLAKYPEYGDMVDAQAQAAPAQEPKWYEKAWNTMRDDLGPFGHPIDALSADVKGLTERPLGYIADSAKAAVKMPIDLLTGMGNEQKKAWDKFKRGEIVSGLTHQAEAMIPMVGPMAGEASTSLEQGNYAEGLGHSLAAGLTAASMTPEGMRLGKKAVTVPARATAKVMRQGGQAVGERLAETAMGIQTRDRLHGRTPGRTALRETKANQPAELAVEAQQRAAELTKELETAAAKSEMPATVDQAIAMLDEEAARAVRENNPELLKQVNQLKNRMTMDLNGQPFPRWTKADHVLALKRGVDDLIASWGPREQSAPIEAVRHKLYGVLDRELERTVPEAKNLNPRIGDLVTVSKRAEFKGAGPDLTQRLVTKASIHTGALASAGLGWVAGGPTGMVAGFFLPELAANPRVQMKVARFLAGDQTAKLTPREIGGLPPKVAMMVINGGKKPPSGGGGGGGRAIPVNEALKDLHSTYGVTESHLKSVVEDAGLKYNGIMDTSISRNGLQAFVTDPATGSTHTIRVDALLNPESLSRTIEKKRYEFSHPQIQPALPLDATPQPESVSRTATDVAFDRLQKEMKLDVVNPDNGKKFTIVRETIGDRSTAPTWAYVVRDQNGRKIRGSRRQMSVNEVKTWLDGLQVAN